MHVDEYERDRGPARTSHAGDAQQGHRPGLRAGLHEIKKTFITAQPHLPHPVTSPGGSPSAPAMKREKTTTEECWGRGVGIQNGHHTDYILLIIRMVPGRPGTAAQARFGAMRRHTYLGKKKSMLVKNNKQEKYLTGKYFITETI